MHHEELMEIKPKTITKHTPSKYKVIHESEENFSFSKFSKYSTTLFLFLLQWTLEGGHLFLGLT